MARVRVSPRLSAALGVFFVLAAFFLSMFAGTKTLSFSDAVRAVLGGGGHPLARTILLQVRLPRACGALVCGASLSVSGLLLQSSLNNSLAAPGIIGVNSGAGFFVLLSALVLPYSVVARAAGAFAGAMAAMMGVYCISVFAGISRTSLILAGVAVSSLLSAGIDVVLTVHPEVVADKVAFSLGGFSGVSPKQVAVSSAVCAAALCGALLLSRGIDLFQLGDDAAAGLGLDVRRHRLLSVLTASVLAAGSVSVGGLLGFVGLIVPNMVRLSRPASCRTGIVLCALWGGSFLLFCDVLSRVLFFPYEVPVGLFLSCLGAPFFIAMLVKRRRRLDVNHDRAR